MKLLIWCKKQHTYPLGNAESVTSNSPPPTPLVQLQRRLMSEARGWLARYGEACRDQQRRQTARLMAHLTQEARRLAQPISDLEDVRAAMEVLRRVRDMEIDTDRAIEPIEVRTKC